MDLVFNLTLALAGLVLGGVCAGLARSEGLVLGAVQVPANGQPLIFLADHPTTGGYPVVGVAEPGSVDAVAQARPGTRVHFRPVLPARPERATGTG